MEVYTDIFNKFGRRTHEMISLSLIKTNVNRTPANVIQMTSQKIKLNFNLNNMFVK